MNNVVIGIGSNIEPEQNIRRAKELLAVDQLLICESKTIETKPLGKSHQPDFLNCSVLLSTDLSKDDLNKYLKKIEDILGRDRNGDKYGPRTIDLDIVVWNDEIVDKDFYSREFIRQTVLEVLPDLRY